jgi:hypothetical protein
VAEACLSIKASDVVLLTPLGATANAILSITITAGTGFSVVSSVADARFYNYVVISTV